jgi:hypothetical protein
MLFHPFLLKYIIVVLTKNSQYNTYFSGWSVTWWTFLHNDNFLYVSNNIFLPGGLINKKTFSLWKWDIHITSNYRPYKSDQNVQSEMSLLAIHMLIYVNYFAQQLFSLVKYISWCKWEFDGTPIRVPENRVVSVVACSGKVWSRCR